MEDDNNKMRPTIFERALSTWFTLAILLISFVLSQTWILMTLAETGQDVGRLQTVCLVNSTNPGAAARDILGQWSAQDIANFQHHFLLDKWFHPILYALFFSSALLHDLLERQQQSTELEGKVLLGRIGIALLLFAGLCDILENIRHSKIQFEPVLVAPDDILVEASILALIKWVIMGIAAGWLTWRYAQVPMQAPVSVPDRNKEDLSWNGPKPGDFTNTPGEWGLVEVQGRRIPWTRTASDPLSDADRSYTVSPYAHYIGYALDEIRIHLNKGPLASFLAKSLVKSVGYIFYLLRFDRAIYFNNYRLSTNMWPTTIKWSHQQVSRINGELMDEYDNQDRAMIWRSVDPLSQPNLTKVLSESSCLLIPARMVNWTEFTADNFSQSEICQKKDFKHDLKLFRRRVGWDILKQEATNSTSEILIVTLDSQNVSLPDAERLIDLYNQLYIDKYSRRNPQLTPAGLIRLARVGFFSIDVLRQRSDDKIVGFCTWSVVDDVGTSAFVGYDVGNDPNRDLYRLVMMMIHNNLVQSGLEKCHMSGGANRFKRRRGSQSSVEYIAVFVDHLPMYRQLPWKLTRWIASKIITVEKAK